MRAPETRPVFGGMRTTILFILALVSASCEPGASCDCMLTINGVTKRATTCGERLCFDGAAFECGTQGTTEVASCSSSSAGGSASGSGAAGGGSATAGGRAGGTASNGTGGGSNSGPSCTGRFSCLSTTCDAATELCNLTLKRCASNTSACRNSQSYCISATSVTSCRSGTRFRCSADSVTGGVTMGCE